MQTRSGAEIVVDADVVYKLHRPGTDPRALAARLGIAAEADSLLTPLAAAPDRIGTRLRTRWPLVEIVVPQPECVPWAEAGRLLASLHGETVAKRPPPQGWPQRLRRAVETLRQTGHGDTIRRAAAGLPSEVLRPGSEDRPRTLVHGDWHLGQLGRRSPTAPWVLIDIDDLGVGDPVWDLARPAGFWAAGLLPDADWHTLLESYLAAGGVAIPTDDPWPVLEPFARAAVVVAAAAGLTHDEDDEAQEALVAACARML
ncbi:MAG: aminoglycoside phosphotransferase family protein [Mycobacterium sp.]